MGADSPVSSSDSESRVPHSALPKKSPDLRVRTKAFALRVMRLVDTLPATRSGDVIGKQLLRSATSVGANYRAACRGRSPAEFVAKLGVVEEEADESAYWFELLTEGGLVKPEALADLHAEAGEIVTMVVASIKTTRNGTR
ncbi:four helix bundle protein [Gemmata sp. JC717]|uniref:four helix bundle protein n=1 Tax=Gemmata algarum TaxID=2975278 RepID=UPI0021BB71FB|nr:four helix bundle protein [Gemmata algarum]MDY3552353.1 four helix bundle protein [Gemmata algarum]